LSENLTGRNYLQDVDVNGGIILKFTSEKEGVYVGTGLKWFMIGSSVNMINFWDP